MKKVGLGLIVLGVLAGAAVGLFFRQKEGDLYVFAADGTWPPMEFLNAKRELTGFSVDLLEAISQEAGFSYQLKNVSWDGIFAGLHNETYDAIMSSVTITEERKKKVDFSDPYVYSSQVLLTMDQGSSNDDSQSKGKLQGNMGALMGSVGADMIKKTKGAKLRVYDLVAVAATDLKNGYIDGIVLDSPVAAVYRRKLEKGKTGMRVNVTELPETFEPLGMCVKKGTNAKLVRLFNEGLEKVKNSGKFDALVAKWL